MNDSSASLETREQAKQLLKSRLDAMYGKNRERFFLDYKKWVEAGLTDASYHDKMMETIPKGNIDEYNS
jgi:hypothetical protein